LIPIGAIPLAAFAELCKAARAHGNGVVEVTARGSIQVRGLNYSSAARFAASVARLGIAAADGVPVLSGALAGLDAEELLDAGALAADLRLALARGSLPTKLGAKVSVAVDGGGALNLDALAADVRLCAEAGNDGVVLHVGVGGDGGNATQLGLVAPAHGVDAAVRLLEVIGRRGRDARARDILSAETTAVFRSAIADLFLGDASPRRARATNDAIGLHRLRDGSLACGIGVAFGHADAASLEQLVEAASAAGSCAMRAAAGRALMIIGLTKEASTSFSAIAERLGFIVRADDARRHVVACAGAPICASAAIAARAMGPQIAAAAAPYIDDSFTIHISGCAKGCAHPGPAALTVVGTSAGCALVANGSTRDTPLAVIPTDEAAAAIARLAHQHRHEGDHV
jgi:precorrin-3B synthase